MILKITQEDFLSQFDGLRSEMEKLKVENTKLTTDLKELKSQISQNSAGPFNKDNVQSHRTLSRTPSCCQDWADGSGSAIPDGIYLLKNRNTNKLQAFFCQFAANNQARKNYCCLFLYHIKLFRLF